MSEKTMLVGALAGLCSDAMVHPMDTIRTNTILKNKEFNKFNLRHLYRGFSVVGLFTIPAHAAYFFSYEKSKELLHPYLSNNLTYLASGFIADIFGALFWCPMDVMKQRFQYHQKLTFKEMFTKNSNNNYLTNLKNNCKMIFKGFGTSIIVYGPYVSFYFMLYENFKNYHKLHFTNKELSLPYFMLYASTASTISAILTTPLDVIKTNLQTLDQFKSPIDVVKNLKFDVKTYFNGWKPRAIWMASGTALTMVFYEEWKKLFILNENDLKTEEIVKVD
ncbi:hypothetical protein ABK040_001401 [Willaertia magna]